MNSFISSLPYWASIAEALGDLFGLVQSKGWLPGIAALFALGFLIAIFYAQRERERLFLAGVKVEGRNIDSLNIANLRRRINRSLAIQEAHHFASIDGEDLTIRWRYAGYCRADHETSIDFSIDTDNNIPFDKLECFAYDLRHDPLMKHKIQPILVAPDGISKKVTVPFLERLTAQEPFAVLLVCKLPGCMKDGVAHYTSTLSFEQDKIRHYSVRLLFLGHRPEWLRVYESLGSGNARLLRDLRPSHETRESIEYIDSAEDVSAKSVRIYVFSRAPSRPVSGTPLPDFEPG
jgi:hypothetical protein